MFAKSIVMSDAFLDMPMSARCLYFTLGMFADDDGFCDSPKGIMRQCGASQDDLNVLIAKRFVLLFESGVIVIKHWRINNYLRNDRYKETTYADEKALLELKPNGAYTEKNSRYTNGIPTVYPDKDSIGKDSIEKDSISIYQDNISKNIGDRLTDSQWTFLDETFEDFTDLLDLIDDRLKLSNEKINNPYAYIISVAKSENWATKKGVAI